VLDYFDGLSLIPPEVTKSNLSKIVDFMIDLFTHPGKELRHYTKLMIVGFAGVGKSSLVDCLMPLNTLAMTRGTIFKTQYWFYLEGKVLKKFTDINDVAPHREYILEPGKWKMEESKTELSVTLIPIHSGKRVEIHFFEQAQKDLWMARLFRILQNYATHGIEIKSFCFQDDPRLQVDLNLSRIKYSLWDFAGQHSYYNSHHYFISVRSVFLVVWNMKDPEGLEGLRFWFKSLVAHLPPTNPGAPEVLYSIIVVGTHVDKVARTEEARKQRESGAKRLWRDFDIRSAFNYVEVSALTLANISELKQRIMKVTETHTYLKQMVPRSYTVVEDAVKALKLRFASNTTENPEGPTKPAPALPIVDLRDVIKECAPLLDLSPEIVRRALRLLALYGECCYFDQPPALDSTLILNPALLTQDLLANLFNPEGATIKSGGILTHEELLRSWGSKYSGINWASFGQTLVTLLQKFEVSFTLPEDENLHFHLQRCFIPALLGERPASHDEFTMDEAGRLEDLRTMKEMGTLTEAQDHALLEELGQRRLRAAQFLVFRQNWPEEPPHGQIHLERLVKFTVVLQELVSRLIARLHTYIKDGLVWRYDVLLAKDDTRAWLHIDFEKELFEVRLRGESPAACLNFMSLIVAETEIVLKAYEGVHWDHVVRSPHDSNTFIRISDLESALRDPQMGGRIICPSSCLPLHAECLLIEAGMREARKTTQVTLIYKNGAAAEPSSPGFRELQDYLRSLHIPLNTIRQVYQVENQVLREAFANHQELIFQRHKTSNANSDYFKKTHWRSKPDVEVREDYVRRLNIQIANFHPEGSGFNDGSRAFVVPMIQGTTVQASMKIAESGFATIATTDDGYYGKGIYFTSDLKYAQKYATKKKGVPAYIIACVLPGNPYPVTELPYKREKTIFAGSTDLDKLMAKKKVINPDGFYGKGVQSGYQSHYTLVKKEDITTAFPISTAFDPSLHADEIVVFQDAQTLPKFILVLKE